MLPIVGGYLWSANHYASLEGMTEFGIASLFKRTNKSTEFLGSNHKDESHDVRHFKTTPITVVPGLDPGI